MTASRNRSWLSVLVFLVAQQCSNELSSAMAQNADPCPITCLNESICKQGQASFDDHPKDADGNALSMHQDTSSQGYYCECPIDFTGFDCSVPYESCADDQVQHTCYHGGVCLETGKDASGHVRHECDCSNAASPVDGKPYAGKYCDKPAGKICNDIQNDGNSRVFCMNEGTCTGEAAAPCSCPDGFTGAHCEYSKAEYADACLMDCENGGLCQIGAPPPSETLAYGYWDAYRTDDFQYCRCPEGFAGLFCEADETPCGNSKEDGICYHGSVCVESGEGEEFYCDCNAANKRKEGLFAGRYCQYEASSVCPSNHNGLNFCTNNGKCTHDDKGIFTCVCPNGFHGPKCEFPDDQPQDNKDYEECSLQCANDGKCRKGAKEPMKTTIKDASDEIKAELDVQHNEDFEHCVCPEGFTGLTCELEADHCGNGEHVCLHGSTCMKSATGKWSCDCPSAFTEDRKVAGKFCQHHHTSTCTPDQQPKIYRGPTSFAFCVNDGVCKDIVVEGEVHPGCDCPDDYTGEHCELLKAHHPDYEPPITKIPSTGSEDDEKKAAFMYVVLILSSLLLIASVAYLMRMKARERRRRDIIERSQIHQKQTGMTANEVEIEEEFDEIELL